MKKYLFGFLFVVVAAHLVGCGNSQNEASSNQPETKKEEMNIQKITPCLWVETIDAKAVVDYYLSIFKDAKLKEHHKYTNPPEAGGGDFETAIMEINGMEFSILAPVHISSLMSLYPL